MDNIPEGQLKEFIFEASRATYASGDKSIQQKQADGSTTIRYTKDRFSLHDNFFGGEPYGGREVVFLDKQPLWMMVYYGFVHPAVDKNEVYPFLMDALSHSTEDISYRGPVSFEKANWKYENSFLGELGNFSGTEKIFKDSARVYEARYLGGFVDR